jgi:trk system potassium uptake protein TrkA
MYVIIMGCGRVGARLARMLVEAGHEVQVMDLSPTAFDRLGRDFPGSTMVGNGIDHDDLVKAGIERADAFAAVTQGDNRNIMAAQIAKHVFKV